MVVFFVCMIIALVVMFSTIAVQPPGQHDQAPPLAFFGVFGFIWLCGFGGWILNVVLGIVFAIKANHGEWAKYPLIGDFVLNKIVANQRFS